MMEVKNDFFVNLLYLGTCKKRWYLLLIIGCTHIVGPYLYSGAIDHYKIISCSVFTFYRYVHEHEHFP